jgi:biopolymer transport protein ExbD
MQLVEPRPARPLAIRMTPLIDVVFILLVFFMLTTRLLPVSLLEVSTGIQKPTGSSPGEPVPELTILPDRKLQWNGQKHGLDTLVTRLSDAGIGRVNLVAAPEAIVQDFTLALSTLTARRIEPRWRRTPAGDGP